MFGYNGAVRTAPTILHADLDAFYASVEQLIEPRLRARPVAVGGGVVLAASYEAKACGVHAGMAGWQARRLCPGLVFVGGHFREYQRLGDAVIDVLRDFTPLVERISIDEAFLDVRGSTHLFGPPEHIAATIRSRVRDELGLPISVGVATTKHLAKVASQVAKPDGLVVVEAGSERAFLAPLPVELLWGVGPATRARLASTGVRTIGDLASQSPSSLQRLLGVAVGAKLGALAVNDDARRIETHHRARSVGAQSALGRQAATEQLLREALGFLADRIATRLRVHGHLARTITVRVRFTGLHSVTRSVTLSEPVAATLTIAEVAFELASGALAEHPERREITLLAISTSNLVAARAVQLELPLGLADQRRRPGGPLGSARAALDAAVDMARARFGRECVGYARVVFSRTSRVPDAFRELAQSETRGS